VFSTACGQSTIALPLPCCVRRSGLPHFAEVVDASSMKVRYLFVAKNAVALSLVADRWKDTSWTEVPYRIRLGELSSDDLQRYS
jgi:hypothetical protein